MLDVSLVPATSYRQSVINLPGIKLKSFLEKPTHLKEHSTEFKTSGCQSDYPTAMPNILQSKLMYTGLLIPNS